MATEGQINELLQLAENCTETTVNDLVNNKDWGTISFEKAKSDIERLFALCNHLKVLPLDQLPDDVAATILQQGKPIITAINSIRNFTVEQGNPPEARDALVAQVKASIDQFYKTTHIYIPYLAYQRGEIQKNIQELTKSVTEASELLAQTKAQVTEKSSEVDSIIRAAREATASVGVAHFTGDFDAEYKTLETTAETWLKATGGAAVLTLLTGFYFLLVSHPSLDNTGEAIHFVTTKLIILSVLLTATVWCGNIYKAVKHQASSNKFKANSLKTFQAFVKAADDDAIRDAVLIETTRAIFSESPTGYITNDSTPAEKGTRIIEVVKNATQLTSAAGKAAS